MNRQVTVTLKKSLIGCTKKQKSAVRCLGLKKPGQKIVLPENPVTKGQMEKVKHLITLEYNK